MLGKHLLENPALPGMEGVGRTAMPRLVPGRGEEGRAVSGWTGRQAGSPTVPGGAEDALSRP